MEEGDFSAEDGGAASEGHSVAKVTPATSVEGWDTGPLTARDEVGHQGATVQINGICASLKLTAPKCFQKGAVIHLCLCCVCAASARVFVIRSCASVELLNMIG